jgi:hypothetical protein
MTTPTRPSLQLEILGEHIHPRSHHRSPLFNPSPAKTTIPTNPSDPEVAAGSGHSYHLHNDADEFGELVDVGGMMRLSKESGISPASSSRAEAHARFHSAPPVNQQNQLELPHHHHLHQPASPLSIGIGEEGSKRHKVNSQMLIGERVDALRVRLENMEERDSDWTDAALFPETHRNSNRPVSVTSVSAVASAGSSSGKGGVVPAPLSRSKSLHSNSMMARVLKPTMGESVVGWFMVSLLTIIDDWLAHDVVQSPTKSFLFLDFLAFVNKFTHLLFHPSIHSTLSLSRPHLCFSIFCCGVLKTKHSCCNDTIDAVWITFCLLEAIARRH